MLRFLSIIDIHTSEYTMRFEFFFLPVFFFLFAMSLLFAFSTFLFHFSFFYDVDAAAVDFFLLLYSINFFSIFISLPFFDMPNSNVHSLAFRDITKTHEREGAIEKDIDSVCLRGVIGCISEWELFFFEG